LKISVHEAQKLSLEAIRGFVEASESLRFESESRKQVYGWQRQRGMEGRRNDGPWKSIQPISTFPPPGHRDSMI
jgi:hypothetical protein